jgi:hypothetical protein
MELLNRAIENQHSVKPYASMDVDIEPSNMMEAFGR